MQEFVRLCEDLRYQSVFIEVFYIKNLATQFVVLMGSLVDV